MRQQDGRRRAHESRSSKNPKRGDANKRMADVALRAVCRQQPHLSDHQLTSPGDGKHAQTRNTKQQLAGLRAAPMIVPDERADGDRDEHA